MKKQKLFVNILLCLGFLFSILSFGLMIKVCSNCLSSYNAIAEVNPEYASESLSLFLQTLFAIIFSALSAIATGTIAVLYNLPALKAKKHSQSEELKND